LVQRLDVELKEFRGMQKELSKLQGSRTQYMTQSNENDMVKKELELLEPDSEVFKLIGPALIRQEKNEAISNVSKRLEFILTELKRIDSLSKELERKLEDKRVKVIGLQQDLQQKK